MIEDTGYDSYLCVYDMPDMKDVKGLNKKEIEELRQVEFTKSFIWKYGKEQM